MLYWIFTISQMSANVSVKSIRAVIGKKMTLRELVKTITGIELPSKASGSKHLITESTLFFVKEALRDIAA